MGGCTSQENDTILAEAGAAATGGLFVFVLVCRKVGRVVRRARNHTARECGEAERSVMVDGRVEGERRVLQAMRYDATVCVCLGKAKDHQARNLHAQSRSNPASHLQAAGGQAGSWGLHYQTLRLVYLIPLSA
jgi:hypothetical protein